MNLRWPTRKSRRQCFFCHKMVEVERSKVNDWVCDSSVCGQRNRYEGDQIADTVIEPQIVQLHARPAERYPMSNFESPFCDACEHNLQGYLHDVAAYEFRENASEAEISRIKQEIHSLHPFPCTICTPRVDQIINEQNADFTANLPEKMWMQALARGRQERSVNDEVGDAVKRRGKDRDWEWWGWFREGLVYATGFGLEVAALILEFATSRHNPRNTPFSVEPLWHLWQAHKFSVCMSLQVMSVLAQLKSRRWRFWWSRFRFSAEMVDEGRWMILSDVAIAIRVGSVATGYSAANPVAVLGLGLLLDLLVRYIALLSLKVVKPPPLVKPAKSFPLTYSLVPKPAWLEAVLTITRQAATSCHRILLLLFRGYQSQSVPSGSLPQRDDDDGPIPMDWEPTPPPSSSLPAYLYATPQLTPPTTFDHADISTAFSTGLNLDDGDQDRQKWTAWREGTAKAIADSSVDPGFSSSAMAPPSSPTIEQALDLPGYSHSVYDSSASSIIQEIPPSDKSRIIKAGYACAALARLLYIVQLASGKGYGGNSLWNLANSAIAFEFGLAVFRIMEQIVNEGFTMADALQRTDDLIHAIRYIHIFHAISIVSKANIPALIIVFEQLFKALDVTTALALGIVFQVVWIVSDCILWHTCE